MFRASLRQPSRDLAVSPAASLARTLHSGPQRRSECAAAVHSATMLPSSRSCLVQMPVCHPKPQLAVWSPRMAMLMQPQRRWMATTGSSATAIPTEPLATGTSAPGTGIWSSVATFYWQIRQIIFYLSVRSPEWSERTHTCDQLRIEDKHFLSLLRRVDLCKLTLYAHVGRKVVLQGWVHRSRMMGPLLFVVWPSSSTLTFLRLFC
jgi:hypothetical protein